MHFKEREKSKVMGKWCLGKRETQRESYNFGVIREVSKLRELSGCISISEVEEFWEGKEETH